MESRSHHPVLGQRRSWRWALVLVHRYVGLSIAGFLVIAGLTGAVLTFEPELDAALNPDLFTAPASQRDRLPLDELIRRVQKADARIAVEAAFIPLERNQSLILNVGPRAGVTALRFDQMVGIKAEIVAIIWRAIQTAAR